MAIRKAFRNAVPLLISITSISGGGKTYTALLLAAGLAGPKGRVGFLDTENGRGCLYADSPGIMAALPNGYEIDDLYSPFSPKAYTHAIDEFESAGVNVLVVDSATHEWEGIGGCCDIAEETKLKPTGKPNWAEAKKRHKAFMNRLLATNMHVILCIRGRDKVKITSENKYIPIGIQPVTEKNLVFEMIVSLLLDEKTHFATPVKVPEMLAHIFGGQRMVTVADGVAIRKWNESGQPVEESAQLEKRARAAAGYGMEQYKAFYSSLSIDKKLALQPIHESCKVTAEQADKQSFAEESEEKSLTPEEDWLEKAKALKHGQQIPLDTGAGKDHEPEAAP